MTERVSKTSSMKYFLRDPPLPTREIMKSIQYIAVDRETPLRYFLWCADFTLSQARIYHFAGDLENAFAGYLKFAALALDELNKHPDYKNPEYQEKIFQIKAHCIEALDEIESLRSFLDRKYKEYKEAGRIHRERDKPSSSPRYPPWYPLDNAPLYRRRFSAEPAPSVSSSNSGSLPPPPPPPPKDYKKDLMTYNQYKKWDERHRIKRLSKRS